MDAVTADVDERFDLLGGVTHNDLTAFRRSLSKCSFDCRSEFLEKVKFAVVEDTSPYPDLQSLRAVIFAQHFGLMQESKFCEECHNCPVSCRVKGIPGNVVTSSPCIITREMAGDGVRLDTMDVRCAMARSSQCRMVLCSEKPRNRTG